MKLFVVAVMGILASAIVRKMSLQASNLKSASRITKISTKDLHISKPTWWLESRFHFSFADWYGPGIKQNFGALRVLNDDLVAARAGFGAHPHTNAEIFSYVVSGALTHADSMGNKESLGPGGVQYMSAGTGVLHSEMNEGAETCRFLQVWLTPDRRGHKPQYGSLMTKPEARRNRLLAVLQGTGDLPTWAVPCNESAADAVHLHQDATVMVSEFDPGHSAEVSLGGDRQAYVVAIDGALEVTGGAHSASLDTREAAEIVAGGEAMPLRLTAGPAGAHLMFIEMAAAPQMER